MPNLGLNSSDGKSFWEKYVKNNLRFKETDFEILSEKPAQLFVKEGALLKATTKAYKPGTKLKITDSKIMIFEKKKFASVKILGKRGYISISRIKTPSSGNGTQYEDDIVNLINEAITKNGPLNIKLKNASKIYNDILYAIKVDKKIKQLYGLKFDPKCDIILCKDIKKPVSTGSIYISHKKAGGAEAFQQYSGISTSAGDSISKNKIVKKFLAIVAENLKDDDRLAAPIIASFKDTLLMNRAIYGPEFGGPNSIQHVHLIGQGKPQLSLSSDKKYFTLSFSDHISLSGDLRIFKGPYAPVISAQYRAGRSFIHNGITYNNTRVGIYSYKKVFSSNEKTLFYDL